MRGAVFTNTLRNSWKDTLIWGAGMGAFMWFFVLLTPALNGIDFIKMMEALPSAMVAATGITNLQLLATTEGLIAFGFFSKMSLFFAAYPAFVGMQITANEEDSGIMDVLLSLPIERHQFLLEKFAAHVVNILVLMAMVIAGLFGGLATVQLDVDTMKMVTMTLNMIPILIFILAVTMFIGAMIGRKQIVMAIVIGFIVVSYVIFTIGGMISATWFNPIEMVSFFSYYNVELLLAQSTVVSHIVTMLILSVVFAGAAIYIFNRRDIAN